MSTPTYTLINQITLATASSTVTFSSIPATYRDLILVANTRSSRTTDEYDGLLFRLNADSGNNYSHVMISAPPSGPRSSSGASQSTGWVCRLNTSSGGNTNNQAAIFQLMDYSATDKHKTTLGRGAALQEHESVSATSSRWANTSAVNSITLLTAQGSLAAGSTFSLYGIVG